MYDIKLNDTDVKNVSIEQDGIRIDGNLMNWDMVALPNNSFSILADNKSYVCIVEAIDRAKKTMSVRVNDNTYDIKIQEPIDLLLSKMGLDLAKMQKVEPIKAPMPGLVLKILVTEGQSIKKGEPVLILEAMKMENVFKAPSDAVVKAIKITEKQAVEKGEVLIDLA